MHLAHYLSPAVSGISAAEFARRIGVAPSTVSRWVSGSIAPGADMCRTIFEATDGMVTADDMYGLKPGSLDTT